jgi:methionine sulfoxide reductase heme-binding subunit
MTPGPKQILWLKAGFHLLGLLPLGWLFFALQHDYFGADAAKELIKYCGRTALELLFVTLLISPLAKWTATPALIQVRRLVGLWCYFWACLHLLAFAALELGWDLSLLLGEVVKRPYMLLGSLSWLLLLALAVTSNRWSQQRLGRGWAKLHRLVYVVAVLAPIHYIWSVKSITPKPVIYLFIALLLLLWRLYRRFSMAAKKT